MQISNSNFMFLNQFKLLSKASQNHTQTIKYTNIVDKLQYERIANEQKYSQVNQRNTQSKLSAYQVKSETLSHLADLVDGLKEISTAYTDSNISKEEKSRLLNAGKKIFGNITSIIEKSTFNERSIFGNDSFPFLVEKKEREKENVQTVEKSNTGIIKSVALKNKAISAYEQTNNVFNQNLLIDSQSKRVNSSEKVVEEVMVQPLINTPTLYKREILPESDNKPSNLKADNLSDIKAEIDSPLKVSSTKPLSLSNPISLNPIKGTIEVYSATLTSKEITTTSDNKVSSSNSKTSLLSSIFNKKNEVVEEIREYALDKPTVNIPDQGKYTGYKEIYNDNGNLVYKGFLLKGQFYGYGTLYNEDGTTKYQGDWKKGQYDGFGTVYKENGSILYQGFTDEGLVNGLGIYYHEDGTYYQGTFKKNYRQGLGITKLANGSIETKYYTDYTKQRNANGLPENDDATDNNGSDIKDNEGITDDIGNNNEPELGNNGDTEDNPEGNPEGNPGHNNPPINQDDGNSNNNENPDSNGTGNSNCESSNGSTDENTDGLPGNGDTSQEVDNPNNESNQGNGGNNDNVDDTSNNGNVGEDSNNTGNEEIENNEDEVNENPTIVPPLENTDKIPDNTIDDSFLNNDWIKENLEDPIKYMEQDSKTHQFILESRLRYQEKLNDIHADRLERIESAEMAKMISEEIKKTMLSNLTNILQLQQLNAQKVFLAKLLE